MGQFEKIVVLIVLFLVTVIFVVTLNPKEDGFTFDMDGEKEVAELDQEQAPFEAAQTDEASLSVVDRGRGENPRRSDERGHPGKAEVEEGANSGEGLTFQEIVDQDRQRAEAAERGQEPDLLLDAGGKGAGQKDPAKNNVAAANGVPGGSALITIDGLEKSWADDLMEYTWKKGDTFVSLAERFYGERSMTELLRQFNEDVSYKRPGDTILVPVYDRRDAPKPIAGTPGEATPSKTIPAAGSTYKVVDGDSLWVIAKKVYGKGHRWEEIFEANKSQLSSPDDVSVDMVLVIP